LSGTKHSKLADILATWRKVKKLSFFFEMKISRNALAIPTNKVITANTPVASKLANEYFNNRRKMNHKPRTNRGITPSMFESAIVY
jgi:hypothetical protein